MQTVFNLIEKNSKYRDLKWTHFSNILSRERICSENMAHPIFFLLVFRYLNNLYGLKGYVVSFMNM